MYIWRPSPAWMRNFTRQPISTVQTALIACGILHCRVFRTTISVMLILQVGNLLSVNFDQIYILINDMVLETGETLDYYVYRVGLYSTNNFSQATAVGLIKSLIGFVLVITTNIITKKMTDGEGGIW